MQIVPVRRVVTGHDAAGRAIVVDDGPSPNILSGESRSGVSLTDLWVTEDDPVIEARSDRMDGPVLLGPPPGGTIFRVVQYDPEVPDELARVDGEAAFAAMGAAGNVVAGARHPYMHRTETVDYAIILSGTMTLLLDDEDVELGPGDVVIQNGTNHAWSNRGPEPCFIAFVLIDARRAG